MLLHTPIYLVFFASRILPVLVNPGKPRANIRPLIASYIFYVAFDVRFALILFALTVATYFIGLQIRSSSRPRMWMIGGVLLNLGALGIFKYLNFFLDFTRSGLQAVGVNIAPTTLNLLLPVGISFYVFQAISYALEIYRRKLEPTPNFMDFALYLAFFPKLVAGPLVRPAQFFKQTAAPLRRLEPGTVRLAVWLLATGLVKKLLIADTLASLSDVAYRAAALPNSTLFPAPLYWQGFYLFAFQIYADFSGYTDIARASAMLLGFSLPENFKQPYLTTTIGEFWNAWHMSLTAWFREYLFFPLSRALLKRTDRHYARTVQVFSNFITMILIGLWHGAAWTFVVWGAWHGLLLSIERILGLKPDKRWQAIISTVITFHLVAFGWILFRADSVANAAHFVAGMFSFQQINLAYLYLPSILVIAILVFGSDALNIIWNKNQSVNPAEKFKLNGYHIVIVASIVIIINLWLITFAQGGDNRPFIYGRF